MQLYNNTFIMTYRWYLPKINKKKIVQLQNVFFYSSDMVWSVVKKIILSLNLYVQNSNITHFKLSNNPTSCYLGYFTYCAWALLFFPLLFIPSTSTMVILCTAVTI